MPQENNNNDKVRKSEAQKRFEEADNAGRFAGDDQDARKARAQAEESIRQDTQSSQSERNRQEYTPDNRQMGNGEIMDADDVRPAQANMMDAEAQNSNRTSSGADLLDNEGETEHARNKAMQGKNENRDTDSSDDRSRYSGSR